MRNKCRCSVLAFDDFLAGHTLGNNVTAPWSICFTLSGGKTKPNVSLNVVLRHSFAFAVINTEVVLGLWISLCCCFATPLQRFCIILCQALAFGITSPKVGLRIGIS